MARIYRSRTVRSVLANLERQQRIQGTASVLARSGLSVPDEGVTAVDGDLQAESFAAGSTGWRLQAGGNAEFNDLTLRGGIIGNDALSQPVVPGVANVNASAFSLSNSFAERAGINLTIPDGCTVLLATCSVWLQAYNTNSTGGSNGAGADYIYAYAQIGSTAGEYKATGISGNNGTAMTSAGLSTLLTGLTPGGTVRLSAYCSSQYTTIASSSNNSVTLSASLMWLR